jgi:hypothetical protein
MQFLMKLISDGDGVIKRSNVIAIYEIDMYANGQ